MLVKIIMIMQFLYNAMNLSLQTDAWVMDVLKMDVDVGARAREELELRALSRLPLKLR